MLAGTFWVDLVGLAEMVVCFCLGEGSLGSCG